MTTAAATQQIWEEFHGRLLAFVVGRVGDRTIAEDILQDVFLKVHGSVDQLRDETKIASWVYQVARNAVIDYYRSHRRSEELDEELPADTPPAALVAEQRLADGLHLMIEELPEKYREALRLTEIEGLTQAEMAERLGLSVSGAKARVQRGREQLREILLDCCHVELDQHGRVIDYVKRPVCCDRTSR